MSHPCSRCGSRQPNPTCPVCDEAISEPDAMDVARESVVSYENADVLAPTGEKTPKS